MSHNNTIPSYYRYVQSITIDNAGSGYDSANPPAITISGGGGSGATATCTVVGGQISTVTVTNIGNGYTSAPTVTVAGSGGASLTAVLSFASGPSSHYLAVNGTVTDKLPEFIKEEYTTFVSFIEKYYAWMDQEDNPIHILLNRHYNDIDDSTDTELEKWRLLLAEKWPTKIPADKRFFYKRIKDIYESKGTKSSIETFFRLFYAEDVDVLYPSKNILRTSDGRWQQKQSVKATSANNYEVLQLQGSLIDIYYYTTTGSITKTEKIEATVSEVLKLAYTSPQQYEVFLNFNTLRSTIPGAGTDGEASIVFEGPIATVDTVSAADASRLAGTYAIGASDWSSDGAGSNAEFSVVVDGSGAATVTITTDGEGFVIDETITITDANLGAGGAANLTFDVATLLDGELKINDITLLDAGQDYLAAPVVTITDPSGGSGVEARATVENSLISDFVITEKGSGYDSTTTTISLETDTVRSYITLRGEETVRAYLDRSLTSISSTTYSGSNAGFNVGEIYVINELGDDARGYALDYFAEDYVLIGGANNAFGRVTAIKSTNVPDKWSIVNPGYGFNIGSTNINLTSSTGVIITVTIETGYLFSYEGQYLDDRGKLSDVNRLQDNDKYQVYSYVIKSTNPQSDWNQILKETIHPAGWEVFGELSITNEISFASNLEIVSPGYHIRFFEEDIFAGEGGETSEAVAIEYNLTIPTDTATATEADVKNVGKTLSDGLVNGVDDTGDQTYFAEDYMLLPETYVSEGGFIKLFRGVQSDVSSVVDNLVPVTTWDREFTDSVTVSEVVTTELLLQRAFSDSTNIVDNGFTLRWNKDFSDTASAAENLNSIDTEINKSDTATTSQTLVINTSSGISDTGTASESSAKNFTTSRSDSATTSDSGTINGPQDYVDATYFAEDYMVGTTLGTF
jgi:hypothetical protein